MSSTRSLHSLRGTHSLAEYPLAELRLDSVAHDEVHAAAEELFERPLHAEEVEEPDRPIELDEQVHIAARPRVTASDRTEDLQREHPERLQLGRVRRQPLLDLSTRHTRIIARAAKPGQRACRTGTKVGRRT